MAWKRSWMGRIAWASGAMTSATVVRCRHRPGRVVDAGPGRGWVVSPVCCLARCVVVVLCGRLGLEAGFAGGGEGVGEHADRDVVVQRGPGADLVLVQADQVLALLVAFLDPPPGSGDRDHRVRRRGGRGVSQEVGHLGRVGDAAADHHSVGEPVRGGLLRQGDGEERPVVEPFALRPVPTGTAFPPGSARPRRSSTRFTSP